VQGEEDLLRLRGGVLKPWYARMHWWALLTAPLMSGCCVFCVFSIRKSGSPQYMSKDWDPNGHSSNDSRWKSNFALSTDYWLE
jgi:hypothetical protein